MDIKNNTHSCNAMPSTLPHIPVMACEVLHHFQPKGDSVFVDCTFGSGGHTSLLLEGGAFVYAIDRDGRNAKFASYLEEKYPNRFVFINDKFSNLKQILEKYNITKCDGILYDIGVSSMQLDESDRGFSFMRDGMLSMQMGLNELSAYDVINTFTESKLVNIIQEYGEDKNAVCIAKKICEYRKNQPISSTIQLANIIKSATRCYNEKIHPATKTFQAIRIFINNELHELECSLHDAVNNLYHNTIIIVISFHSLEDRIVKNIFNEYQPIKKKYNKYKHIPEIKQSITLEVLHKKPLTASAIEVNKNPRSRSAKMRIARLKLSTTHRL